MSVSIVVALALSSLIGVALGLSGGGGSILAVPVLVYVARVPPRDAIAMSLLVVGVTSAVGAVAHARGGSVDWRAAWSFGGAGVIAAALGARLTRLVPATVLLLAFALLMIVVGAWMRFGSRGDEAGPARPARPLAALVAGAGVGVVTGLLGVGGGFLIVPALVALTRLGMRRAIGTSLVVIALDGGAGLVGHLGQGDLHLALAAPFTACAVGGALAGARLGERLSPATLRSGFASVVIAVGAVMAARTLFAG